MTVADTAIAQVCAACGSADEVASVTLPFSAITSDSKPWPRLAPLRVCRCGLVSKRFSDQWRADAAAIYDAYSLYHLTAEVDQVIRATSEAALQPRADAVAEYVAREIGLGDEGRLLDVGCGNGAMLQAFGRWRPRWALSGNDLTAANGERIRSLPGVRAFYSGPVGDVPGTFDVITLIHVLEHVESVRDLLADLARHLGPTGVVAVQVPDYRQNPFDLLVADHATHFSLASLTALLGRSGYEIVAATDRCVPKELTVLARAGSAASPSSPEVGAVPAVEHAVAWLNAVVERFDVCRRDGRIGVFGTAIAGTWLASQRAGAVDFFVDENERCVGKEYFGRPVLRPRDAPPGSSVLIAQPPRMASAIATRLKVENPACRWELVP